MSDAAISIVYSGPAQILKGDKSVIPANKQINVPTLVIKKDSVEDFTKKINQLRGRS